MASPMTESRIEPHKKAHFSLHISDRIATGNARGSYSSVKYNHKPTQTAESRTTTLTSTSPNTYKLRLEDKNGGSANNDVFTFTGSRIAPKKSYVLLLDPASQRATLEPLSAAYTFNLATRNKQNISSEHPKIYPKKSKEDPSDGDGEDDLFGQAEAEDESGDPDPSNPYDFRHFLAKEKEKRGDESEYYNASSPDNRAGTDSARNTPQFGARKPAEATAPKAKPAEPAPKKRKTAESGMFMKKKPGVKKAQPTPSIHLERRASERPIPDAAPKPKTKAAGPPASKIKSAELVHSSDESDVDVGGDAEPVSSPRHTQSQRSPSPRYQPVSEQEDEDAEGESDDDGVLEIEVPDARSSRPRNGGALKSLGYGQNLGMGGGFRSPSNGPISLASATNSNQGSPHPHDFTPRKNRLQPDDGVIDFGDLESDAEGEDDDEDGGELDIDQGIEDGDGDVEEMDLGPPARQSAGGHDRKASVAAVGAPADEDEEDPLYQEMMAGLADGDSSEESEEE